MDAKILEKSTRRKLRIKQRAKGTNDRPRLTVSVSSRHVSAQVIDDQKHITIASSTTVGNAKLPHSLTDRAIWVGEDIGKKAIKKNVKKVVFDRNGKLYHGRIAALADAARNQGLEF